MPTIEVLTPSLTVLGENPLWDVEEERLYWIDVFGDAVLRCTADGRETRVVAFPGHPTSLALRAGGGALATTGATIRSLDLDSGETEVLFDAAPQGDMSFNDAKVDRKGGRFVTGLTDRTLIDPETFALVGTVEPKGLLYGLAADGTTTALGQPIGSSNGPAFSPDGTTLYWNDSWSREILAFDYDVATGAATNRRTLVDFHADTPEGDVAVPDGATVDEEGALWVACFYGGEIRRYTPDGVLERRVPMPVQNPTSVAFGGPGLDVLYVTSMALTSFPGVTGPPSPLAGTILAVSGLGARGVPETRFAGQPADAVVGTA
jgi:sugar lactone lactonase YvrE